MKYSVIIPVYKAENTINKCVDSLLNQTFEDMEILLINDGSPDKCGSICSQYADNFPNVRYFEKENGGVSSARNIGLQEAKGEYILFVDSDDYVASDYFVQLERALQKYETDMLLYSVQYTEKEIIWKTGDFDVRNEDALSKRISSIMKAYLFSSLMSKVFRKSIIDEYHIFFDEKLDIGEDQAFIFEYAMHIHTLTSISNVLYYVVIDNEDSLSRKKRDYLAEQLFLVDKKMLSSLKRSDHSAKVKKRYYDAIVWGHYRAAYSSSKELLKFNLSTKERRKKIREICKMYSLWEFRPMDLPDVIIATPVVLRMISVIDVMIRKSQKKRMAELQG